MRIKKFAGGGYASFHSLQTPWTPPALGSNRQDNKTGKSSESLIDDEMYKMLINQGGLKVDVEAFSEKLNRLTADPNTFLQDNASTARRMFPEISALRQNKEMWEFALKQATNLGGLNEVAVGTQGEMYVIGKNGQIGAVASKEFDPKKHRALTVSELLIARQENSNLANNQSVFTVATNAVGMDNIIDRINKIVSMAGTESKTSEKVYNENEIPRDAKKQLEVLGTIVGNPDGGIALKEKISSQRNQFNAAFKYIWSALGRPAQMKLAAMAAQNGTDTSEMIANALLFGTDYSTEYTVSSYKSSSSSDSSSGSSAGTKNMNIPQLWTGMLPDKGVFTWNDPNNSSFKLSLPTTFKAPLTYENGEPIGTATIDKISKTIMGSVADFDEAYFGNKKLGINDKSKIIYDSGHAGRTYLPTYDGKTPNYELLRRIEEVKEEIDPSWTPKQINDFYKSKNLDVKVDNEGLYVETSVMKPFLVFYGYGEEGTDASDNNTELEIINRSEKSQVKDLMKEVWKSEKKGNLTSGGWDIDKYYKGIVAVPMSKASSLIASSATGSGPRYRPNSREEVMFNLQTNGRNVTANQFDLNE